MTKLERKINELKLDDAAWSQVIDTVTMGKGFLNAFKGINRDCPNDPASHYSKVAIQAMTHKAFEDMAMDLISDDEFAG